MSVKIRVSYERPEELQRILDKLAPDAKTVKVGSMQKGQFKRAYIEIDEARAKQEG